MIPQTLAEKQQRAVGAVRQVHEFFATSPVPFAEAVEPMKKLEHLYAKVNPVFIAGLPEIMLGEIADAAKESHQACQPAITQVHQSPVERAVITGHINDALAKSNKLLPYAIRMSEALNIDISEVEAKIRKISEDAERKLADLSGAITAAEQRAKTREEETEKETKRLLGNLRTASEEAGITKPANFYEEQAKRHFRGMLVWFALSVIAGSALLLVLFFGESFSDFVRKQNPVDIKFGDAETLLWGVIAQFAVGKALLFSTLGYALFFSAKNFMAHNHNYVVNQHRHNALRTYGALMDAMQSDKNARDIVLMQAAHCIFAPQNTGYAKDEGGGGDAVRFIPMEAAKEAIESAGKK